MSIEAGEIVVRIFRWEVLVHDETRAIISSDENGFHVISYRGSVRHEPVVATFDDACHVAKKMIEHEEAMHAIKLHERDLDLAFSTWIESIDQTPKDDQ